MLAGIAQRYEAERGSLSGTPSGLEQLDALTCCFQPAGLIIAAARPSVGKTAFALTLCVNVLMRLPTQPVQIYSMEMSAEQLLLRLISLLGRVLQTRLRSGDLSDDDWQHLGISANILIAEWKDRLLIDNSGILTPSILRSHARRSLRKYSLPSLIVIDYLQLMRSGGAENSNQEISTISRSLKALAKELSCPVLGCALLSAGNVTLIFLLRLAILLQARPLFVLTMTIGFVDGLVRRDLRRFGSGHARVCLSSCQAYERL